MGTEIRIISRRRSIFSAADSICTRGQFEHVTHRVSGRTGIFFGVIIYSVKFATSKGSEKVAELYKDFLAISNSSLEQLNNIDLKIDILAKMINESALKDERTLIPLLGIFFAPIISGIFISITMNTKNSFIVNSDYSKLYRTRAISRERRNFIITILSTIIPIATGITSTYLYDLFK